MIFPHENPDRQTGQPANYITAEGEVEVSDVRPKSANWSPAINISSRPLTPSTSIYISQFLSFPLPQLVIEVSEQRKENFYLQIFFRYKNVDSYKFLLIPINIW